MKQKISLLVLAAFAMVVTIGCATTASGPVLGTPTELQTALNQFAPITVAGKKVKFEFGGETWIATVNGKNFLAGTFTSVDTNDGSTITLKQTHAYSDKEINGAEVGWVNTSGPDVVLVYKKGPPAKLTVK